MQLLLNFFDRLVENAQRIEAANGKSSAVLGVPQRIRGRGIVKYNSTNTHIHTHTHAPGTYVCTYIHTFTLLCICILAQPHTHTRTGTHTKLNYNKEKKQFVNPTLCIIYH